MTAMDLADCPEDGAPSCRLPVTKCCMATARGPEPCVCDTDFTCLADEHDKGRCDACETPGIFPLCCGEHQARMCTACAEANHGAA